MGNHDGFVIAWEEGVSQSELFGAGNRNIDFIEENMNVKISPYPEHIAIRGENAAAAHKILKTLISQVKKGHAVGEKDVKYYYEAVISGENIEDAPYEIICHNFRGRPIRCKTFGQKKYVEAMKTNEITFCIGPAGTGKTYLAMAMAITALKAGDINRIVLVRPAVEAGERLGFLPGDLKEKVDPYLRPLYDALYDIIGAEAYERYMSRGAIEIAPLAYMRGRTLDESYIILDEAQNTTPEQMKMFLTRLGFNSRAVITGDVTQIDLPFKDASALKEVRGILGGVKGISFTDLTNADVVRNPIVQRIINAYEKHER